MSDGITEILGHAANLPDLLVQVVDFTSDRAETVPADDLERLASACQQGSVTWIDIKGYSAAHTGLIESLGERLGLHALAVEDVLHTGQPAKTDDYNEFLFAILRHPERDDDGSLTTSQVNFFLGPGFVVSLQESVIAPDFDGLRRRILAGTAPVRKRNSGHLAHRLIDVVIDSYFPIVEQLVDRLDSIEEAVERGHETALKDLHAVSREAIQMRRLLRDHRDAVQRLAHSESSLLDDGARRHLGDVLDHANRLLSEVDEIREVSVGLRELHLSLANQRMNEVIRLLTVISTIFIPLSFFTGVYGMNFTHMPELPTEWGYAVWWVVSLSVAIGMLLWFRRKGWLGGNTPGAER